MEDIFNFLISFFTSVMLMSPTVVQVDPTLIKLDDFLKEKNSPLPASELVEYDNWEMVVALSSAESGYGKHMAGEFNAWGIKDFQSGSSKYGGTRDFSSWGESIEYTSKLLYQYDPQDGMPSPRSMVRSWKYVLPYEHWVNNVQYALYDLEREVLN